MDLSTAFRDIVRQRYPALRRSLTALEEGVIHRYWDEGALVRVTFERFITSLDECAERLLAEGEPGAPEEPRAPEEPIMPDVPTADDVPTAAAHDEPRTPETPTMPAEPSWPAEPTMRAEPSGLDAPDMSDESDTQGEPAAGPEPVGTVAVAFTLPAEVEANTVALCGEFNDWSADDILLERGPDRTWRTTVALEPGRSYRYRYLLDGERWENGQQADNYAPNPYGTVDSVIVVR